MRRTFLAKVVSRIVIINRRGPLSTTSRRDPFFFIIIRCHLSGSRDFFSGGRHGQLSRFISGLNVRLDLFIVRGEERHRLVDAGIAKRIRGPLRGHELGPVCALDGIAHKVDPPFVIIEEPAKTAQRIMLRRRGRNQDVYKSPPRVIITKI